MNAEEIQIGYIYRTQIGGGKANVQVRGLHADGKRFIVARPTALDRTMVRSARALHECRKPKAAPAVLSAISIEPESAVVFPAAAPVRKDNRGGYRASNPGGRPSNASKGLESRNCAVMIKFTESELTEIRACMQAESPDAELSVWLRNILLGMIGG